MSLLLVITGAAVGTPVRCLTDRALQPPRHGIPLGTLTVNVLGSLILGMVTGAVTAGGASPQVQLALGTGFCGALTTYSTFLASTLHTKPAALGAIEGVSDALTGLSKLAGGPVANDPERRGRLTSGGYLGTAIATAAIGLTGS